MAVILLVLLLAFIFGAAGCALHVLWWIALLVFAGWLIGFGITRGEALGRRRWYGRHWYGRRW